MRLPQLTVLREFSVLSQGRGKPGAPSEPTELRKEIWEFEWSKKAMISYVEHQREHRCTERTSEICQRSLVSSSESGPGRAGEKSIKAR